MKQRCELLKLKAFLAFVSSQQYAQMYANHTLKDFSLYRKSFAANSLIKPNSIRQMKQKNRSEYCELFLRNLFFSFIFIDAVPPIRKRFAMKHFAATKFFFLSVFSFAVGVVIVVRCWAVRCGINVIRIQKFKPTSNSHEMGTCFTYFADF